jgi:hypothetical protein
MSDATAVEIDRLRDLETKVETLCEKMDAFIALASDIKNNVEPALDSIKNSPVGKMLGM